MKRTHLKRKPYKLRHVSKRRKENLEVSLWTAFSLYIRNRDNWTCFTCGARWPRGSGQMQAGHYKPQGSFKSVIYDPKNCHAQCVSCNKWRHGNLNVYAEKLVRKYGKQEFLALCERAKKEKQWTKAERAKLLEILKERPETYEREYYKILIS